MYEQFIAPEPIDRIRNGLPNLRHGNINHHPLELALKEADQENNKDEYFALAALYGQGYAEMIKRERKMIAKTEIAHRGFSAPNRLGLEIATGEIDDIDFGDMFVPEHQYLEEEIDPHDIQERRFFK